jgi:hypothetical protein
VLARLACAYVAGVGQGTQEEAVTRVKEVLRKMAPVPDRLKTDSHYSTLHLILTEAIVLAFPPCRR